MKLNNFIVLEALRKTDKEIPINLGKWESLAEVIIELVELNWLQQEADSYKITSDGKKAIILFNSEKRDVIKPLERYKSVKVGLDLTDCRLAKACKDIRNVLPDEFALAYLSTMNTFIKWDSFFDTIKRLDKNAVNWQAFLLTAFENARKDGVDLNAWKILPEEKPLCQITRTNNIPTSLRQSLID